MVTLQRIILFPFHVAILPARLLLWPIKAIFKKRPTNRVKLSKETEVRFLASVSLVSEIYLYTGRTRWVFISTISYFLWTFICTKYGLYTGIVCMTYII